MTTSVLIVNHGPDHVLVQGVSASKPTELGTLPPHSEGRFYVHDHQQLLITELKKGTT